MPAGKPGRNPNKTPTKHRNKYRNRPVYLTPDGKYVGADYAGPKRKVADSEKEFKRFLQLRQMEEAGVVAGLRFQVRFPLAAVGGKVVTRYVADFVYVENGARVVEDVKGRITPLYRLKKKWMESQHGVVIREV